MMDDEYPKVTVDAFESRLKDMPAEEIFRTAIWNHDTKGFVNSIKGWATLLQMMENGEAVENITMTEAIQKIMENAELLANYLQTVSLYEKTLELEKHEEPPLGE